MATGVLEFHTEVEAVGMVNEYWLLPQNELKSQVFSRQACLSHHQIVVWISDSD